MVYFFVLRPLNDLIYYNSKNLNSLIFTTKRWIRVGKLPNSFRNSDKEGWRIIESDLLQLNHVIPTNNSEKQQFDKENDFALPLHFIKKQTFI